MERLLEQFKTFIGRWRGGTIYVGFSGGADSTALLLLLDRCVEEFGLRLRAVHFDHGLRSGSDADALWCEDFCVSRYIDFRLVRLNVPAMIMPGESVEAAARRLRLEQWEEVAGPGAVIALGHHSGDRVENALLRFCRGANVTGLCSLRPVQKLGELSLIRPLLGWSRADIEAFLLSVRVTCWREDPSNRDPVYKRNLFRQVILPRIVQDMPFAAGGMLRSLDALEQDAAFIEEAAARQFQAWRGKKSLPVEFLRRLHPALLVRVLRLWLSERTGSDTIPDHHLVRRVAAAAAAEHGGETRIIPCRGNLELEIRAGRLSLHRPGFPSTFGTIEWDWQLQEEINYGPHRLRAELLPAAEAEAADRDPFQTVFPVEALPELLYVRTWQDGDRLAVPGRTSPVKLKKLFTDRKIRARDKKHYAVIAAPDGEILWVAGFRRRVSVLPPETPVLRLTFLPGEEWV